MNAHIILEEYRGVDSGKWRSLIRKWESELIVIEEETREKLQAAVSKMCGYVLASPSLELRDLAYTQNSRLKRLPFRVSIVATSSADLKQKLERVEMRLADPACKQIKAHRAFTFFRTRRCVRAKWPGCSRRRFSISEHVVGSVHSLSRSSGVLRRGR